MNPHINKDQEPVPNEMKRDTFGLRLFLKAGEVRGLPKTLASAPTKIQLNARVYTLMNEAMTRSKTSGTEWGFFIRLDETGRLIPGELKAGQTKREWITLQEYVQLRTKDPTIRGHLHTHHESPKFPGAPVTISENNIGFFLAAEDVLQICTGSQGDYLLLLRTQQTPTKREGIAAEATKAYQEWAREMIHQNILQNMDRSPAVIQGVFDAMINICKTYNIALYKGELNQAAKKVN